MFYLVGGAPRTGKTTIAKYLSKELQIPWISTDTLESVVSQYVPLEKRGELFPKNIIRTETNQSNDEMYSRYSSEEIKAAYFKQAEVLWDALKAFIESEHQYEHEYILEGYHIPPELVMQMGDEYPMKSIFVGREDIEVVLESITSSTQKSDWVISKTKDAQTFSKIAEMLVSFSRDVRVEAEKRNLPYFEIGRDFNGDINRAIQCLMDAR